MRKDRKSSLGYPFIFILRRLAFALVCLYSMETVVIQLWCLMISSTLQIIYLLLARPFEEELMQKLEIFNEVCTIALIYIMFCFSEANIYRERSPIYIDCVFLASMAINVLVHVYFLMKGSFLNIKDTVKSKCCKKAPSKQK